MSSIDMLLKIYHTLLVLLSETLVAGLIGHLILHPKRVILPLTRYTLCSFLLPSLRTVKILSLGVIVKEFMCVCHLVAFFMLV